mgnify:FL=1
MWCRKPFRTTKREERERDERDFVAGKIRTCGRCHLPVGVGSVFGIPDRGSHYPKGFAKPITRDKALAILKEADQAGLVNKAFHPGARDPALETSICNCCKDCCDIFRLWRDGTLHLINATCHLAVIDADTCGGQEVLGDQTENVIFQGQAPSQALFSPRPRW